MVKMNFKLLPSQRLFLCPVRHTAMSSISTFANPNKNRDDIWQVCQVLPFGKAIDLRPI
jgi:hypothetical protein